MQQKLLNWIDISPCHLGQMSLLGTHEAVDFKIITLYELFSND